MNNSFKYSKQLYVSLYLENHTLESLADKEGYSYVHIQRTHGKLIKFFQEKLVVEGES